MKDENKLLKIVKEDILRILGETEKGEFTIEEIKKEVNVSNDYLSNAVLQLETGLFIIKSDGFLSLTEEGWKAAKEIVKKHQVIENYFKSIKKGRDAHKIAHLLEHHIYMEVIDNIKRLSTLKSKSIPMTKFACGKEGIIRDMDFSDYGIFERVISMGIYPGKRIKIENKLADTIVVSIKNKKIALSKDIAGGILI